MTAGEAAQICQRDDFVKLLIQGQEPSQLGFQRRKKMVLQLVEDRREVSHVSLTPQTLSRSSKPRKILSNPGLRKSRLCLFFMDYAKNKRLLARLIPHRLKRWFQESIYAALRLEWRLASGMVIEVKSPTDWSLLNDIFVDGEYDEPIKWLAGRVKRRQSGTVINLGANVGFFELRLFQLLQRSGLHPSQLRVYAFEPDAENIREFERRLATTGAWRDCATIVQGLAGKLKSGTAKYWKSHNHHSCTLLSGRRYDGSWAVAAQYVDVEAVLEPGGQVDLLKCDIEGSELDFVTAYPELLRRVATVVMEIHDSSHVAMIQTTMAAAGLICSHTVVDHKTNSVRIFSRSPLLPCVAPPSGPSFATCAEEFK